MFRLSLIVTALTTFLLSSCTTDFEMNAPYKRTTIVYGLINQTQESQIIRVQRSFLGKGNANDMAKFKDSIYYAPGELDVKIVKMENNQSVNSLTLEEFKSPQESGVFYSDSVILYRTNPADKTFFEEGYDYQLQITNKTTNQIVSGKTNLIGQLEVKSPSPQYPFIAFKKFDGRYNDYISEWYSSKYGRVYGLTVRFYYVEYNTDGTRRDTAHIDWTQPAQTVNSLNGGQLMSQKLTGETFFKLIGDSIKYRDEHDIHGGTIRRADSSNVWIGLQFSIGNDDLNTYINVNKPSTGIVQERPLFTNITNGIGIFASRFNYETRKKLDIVSETELKNGNYTNGLFR
jgi:hypothetical protein